jgi:hypothetical protein
MEIMVSAYMDAQNRRAGRILRQFAGYVDDAERERREIPAIQRNKPKAHARIKRGVFARLVSRGKVKP